MFTDLCFVRNPENSLQGAYAVVKVEGPIVHIPFIKVAELLAVTESLKWAKGVMVAIWTMCHSWYSSAQLVSVNRTHLVIKKPLCSPDCLCFMPDSPAFVI